MVQLVSLISHWRICSCDVDSGSESGCRYWAVVVVLVLVVVTTGRSHSGAGCSKYSPGKKSVTVKENSVEAVQKVHKPKHLFPLCFYSLPNTDFPWHLPAPRMEDLR